MALSRDIDGLFLGYKKAIDIFFEYGMTIIVMLSPSIALFQAEADFAKPPRFFV